MRTIAINDGTRIRLVVLNVNTIKGDSTNVTLRYDWSGSDPEHMCIADVCPLCTDQAKVIAARRFTASLGTLSTAAIEVLRDGQSTARSGRKVSA